MNKFAFLVHSRLWRQTWESLRHDQLPLQAAALSFQTLAALVPVLAIVLAILSSSAFTGVQEDVVQNAVNHILPSDSGNEEQTQRLQEKAHKVMTKLVTQVKSNVGKLSVAAFITLQVIAMFLFRTIEGTMNTIWKVRSARTLVHRAVVTTALIFWGPVLIALSVTLTRVAAGYGDVAGGYVIPALLTGLGFGAFYMIVPNARVRFLPAFLAGLFAALLWELGKVGFMLYVKYIVSGSTVYGPLGLLPMLLGWLYVSWFVLLAGAELGYILQTVAGLPERWTGRFRPSKSVTRVLTDPEHAGQALPPLALAGAIEVGQRFQRGRDPGGVRLSELARALEAEPALLERALHRLVEAGLLAQVAEEGLQSASLDPRYLPGRDLAYCSLPELAQACRGTAPALGRGPSWDAAAQALARLQDDGARAAAPVTLAELCAAAAPAEEVRTPAPRPAPEAQAQAGARQIVD